MDIEKKRIDCIAKHKLGWKLIDICTSEHIGRTTLYRWITRYQKHGCAGLVRQSTKPHTIHRKLTEDTIDQIIQLRQQTGANEHALQHMLGQQRIHIGHATIYKVLKVRGLINHLSNQRKQRTYVRFQRNHANSLWQTDLTNWNEQVVVAYLDDYSRFVTGIGVFENGLTANVLAVFETAIRDYGKPRQVLTDHGTQFYSVRGGESEFDRFCETREIEHIMGSIGKPTTTGKIERFFGTFKTQVGSFGSIGEFVRYYNHERPHKSLGYQTPASLYLENVP